MFFLRKNFSSFQIKFCLIFFMTFLFSSCETNYSGTNTARTQYKINSRTLSLKNQHFRTCIFDDVYPIVHFPMYHTPTDGQYTQKTFELVAQSQFQLLHTILDYNRSSWDLVVFDEHFSTDFYNETFFKALLSRNPQVWSAKYTKLDGRTFQLGERLSTARALFTSFPGYYEYLSIPQKQFLFDMGASFTLYLLGELPKIYPVISKQNFDLVKSQSVRNGRFDLQDSRAQYWIYTFREDELKKEVLNFLQRNYQARKKILIAYGAKHDFLDDFRGYFFQSGHSFCLPWISDLDFSAPLN